MSVAQVGTPAALVVTSGSNTGSVTGSWATGGSAQPRTAGDLLVAVVTSFGSTTAGTTSTPSGWWKAANIQASSRADVSIYLKVAAGSDTAPTFTATHTGTASLAMMACELFELSGASGLVATGTATGTTGSPLTVTTTGNVPASGCYAIAGWCMALSAAGTSTLGPGSGWTNQANNNSTSIRGHTAVDVLASPTSGSTLAEAETFTGTGSFLAGAMIVIAPATVPGVVQAASATASATSVTATLPNSTQAGNTLFAAISTPVNDASVTGITLGGSADNWAQQIAETGGTYTNACIWADPDCAGSQTSVVVSLGGTDEPSVNVFEVAGLGSSIALDVSVIGPVNGTGAAWTSGATGTEAAANEFVVGVVAGFNNAGGTTTLTGPTSGWVNEAQLTPSTGIFQMAGFEVPSSAGTSTYSGTSNMTSPNNYYTAIAAAFAPAGGTLTASASQTISPSQSAAVALATSASQTIAPSQSAAAAIGTSASQTLSPSQAAAAYATRSRSASQAIAPSQSAAAVAVYVATASQAVTPSQSAAAYAVRPAAAAQTVGPGQSAAGAIATSASQAVTPAGMAAATALRPAAATQTVSPSQAAAAAAGTTAAQTISLTQSAAAANANSPKTATLTDTFAADDLATIWPGTYGTVAVSGGQCSIQIDTSYSSGLVSASTYDLTGSYVFAKVTPYIAASTEMDFQAGPDGSNCALFFILGNQIQAEVKQAGVATSSSAVTYDPTAHQWLRIREMSGTLYFDTAPDGLTWTNFYSVSYSISLSSGVGVFIGGGDYGSDATGTTYVTDVSVAPLPAAAAQDIAPSQAASVTAVRPAPASQSVSPSQAAAGMALRPAAAAQSLTPAHAATAQAIRSRTATQAISITQSAAAAAAATASQAVSVSQSAAATAVRPASAAQTVTAGQTATPAAIRPATAAQTITPSQSATVSGGSSVTYASTYSALYGGSGDAAASQTISLTQSAAVALAASASQAITPSQAASVARAGRGAAAETIASLQTAAFTVAEAAPATQPAVPDFIAGYAPQTADFNAWIQAPFRWLTGKVIFRAELSAATTWTQGVNTLIPFNVIDEDTYGGWNAAAHTWTPPGDGTGTYEVSITASAAESSDSTTALRCGLYLNGSAVYTMSSTQVSQSQPCLTGGSAPVQLYGGQDTISAYAYWNTTSGNGSAVTTAGQRCTMQITWLSL